MGHRAQAYGVNRATILAVVLTIAPVAALGQEIPTWKVFVSRTGWSISYPSDWHIGSCKSCKEPKAPGVYVDFFPPDMRTVGGWVMVQPLADKPSDTSTDAWLSNISKTTNLNPHVKEEKLILHGQPALKVRYRTSEEKEVEEVYLVSGSNTFSVLFTDGETAGAPLEKMGNYPTYLKMLDSFRVKRR
jgi:hypothetical protein